MQEIGTSQQTIYQVNIPTRIYMVIEMSAVISEFLPCSNNTYHSYTKYSFATGSSNG